MSNNKEFYKKRTTRDKLTFETAKNVFVNFSNDKEYIKGFWLSKKLINLSEYSFFVTLNFPSSFKDLNYIEMKYDLYKDTYKEIKRTVLKGDELETFLFACGFDIEI